MKGRDELSGFADKIRNNMVQVSNLTFLPLSFFQNFISFELQGSYSSSKNQLVDRSIPILCKLVHVRFINSPIRLSSPIRSDNTAQE
jgi:hypothetical protein